MLNCLLFCFLIFTYGKKTHRRTGNKDPKKPNPILFFTKGSSFRSVSSIMKTVSSPRLFAVSLRKLYLINSLSSVQKCPNLCPTLTTKEILPFPLSISPGTEPHTTCQLLSTQDQEQKPQHFSRAHPKSPAPCATITTLCLHHNHT